VTFLRAGPFGNIYSATGYLEFDDEGVSLSSRAWTNWMQRWVESGLDVSPHGLLKVPNGTATGFEHDWCQRCEAFLIHDQRAKARRARRSGFSASGRVAQAEPIPLPITR
jgi:hypothetical protein